MKTRERRAASAADTLADRVDGYRRRTTIGDVPEQLHALEARWAAFRAGCEEPFISDQAFFRQALVLAATPASSVAQARAKRAFLIPYVRLDADLGGHRLVTAMIDAAIADDNRRWSGSAGRHA